jgi:hypothetical protein
VILKGEAYPGHAGKGLVHRAPHYSQVDRPRVLLRFDTLDDVS